MGRTLCAVASFKRASRLRLKGQLDQVLGSKDWYMSKYSVRNLNQNLDDF